MKPKMGRPRLPKGEVKDVLIGAKFAPHEADRVHAAVKRAKVGKSEWVRNTLLASA
jgi:hypothetical protein